MTRIASFAAVLAAFATPNLAAASLSCDEPLLKRFVAPAPDSVDVPTNSKIWVSDSFPEIVLLGPDGLEVAHTLESRAFDSFQGLQILTPDAALAPDADHAVWGCDGDDCTTLLSTFHTGAGPSSTAPAVPTVVSTAPGRGCDVRWVDMVVEFTGAVLVVDVVDGAYDDAGGRGLVVSDTRELSAPWPTMTDDAEIRVGTFALDGSFSGWSDPIAVHNELGGCTVGEAPPTSALLLLLLGLRRRRRLSASR